MSFRPPRCSLLCGLAALALACDPNVLIGAKWKVEEGGGGSQVGVAGSGTGGGGAGGAGAGGAGAESASGGLPAAGEGGAAAAGAGGAPALESEWCATAPWLDSPVLFNSEAGSVIPPGSYLVTYVSGAQIHDLDIGYEVTDWYYGKGSLEAGHHVFSGDRPGSGTHLWLDEEGLTGSGGSIAEVEAANRGHTWPLEHEGGELRVTMLDDDYDDNSGPGTRFCITPVVP